MTRAALMLIGCVLATVTASNVAQSASVVSVFASFEKDGRTGAELSGSSTGLLSASLDGKPVEILQVSPVRSGVSMLLLVDLTWTTTRGYHPGHDPDVAHLKRGLASMGMGWIPFPGLLLGLDKAFLPLLGPRDDLRIGSFAGQRITFSRAASTAPARLAAFREVITPDVVPLTDFFGASRVWDAVAAASRQLSNDSSFRSIVLVTDGQASGNRLGHAEAIAAAVSRGVVVHVVGRKSEWEPSMAPPPETFVGRLAEQTGGLLRIDEAPFERHRIPWDEPAPVFRDIVNAIHNSYEIRLNVESAAEGTHQLELKTGVAGMRVHAATRLFTSSSRQEF